MKVLHNSCNMNTCLPVMSTLCPQAAGGHFRQTTSAHITSTAITRNTGVWLMICISISVQATTYKIFMSFYMSNKIFSYHVHNRRSCKISNWTLIKKLMGYIVIPFVILGHMYSHFSTLLQWYRNASLYNCIVHCMFVFIADSCSHINQWVLPPLSI